MSSKEETITWVLFLTGNFQPYLSIRFGYDTESKRFEGESINKKLINKILQSDYDLSEGCQQELEEFKAWVKENKSEMVDEVEDCRRITYQVKVDGTTHDLTFKVANDISIEGLDEENERLLFRDQNGPVLALSYGETVRKHEFQKRMRESRNPNY